MIHQLENMIEKLPPGTTCVLTPKKDCDVLTVTLPKGETRPTGVAFDLWLALSACICNSRRARGERAGGSPSRGLKF